MELELSELKLYAIFFFLILIGHNSILNQSSFSWNLILRKSSFETGTRTYIISKQGHIAKYFLKYG